MADHVFTWEIVVDRDAVRVLVTCQECAEAGRPGATFPAWEGAPIEALARAEQVEAEAPDYARRLRAAALHALQAH